MPISIARGVIRCQEVPQMDIAGILDLADQRMYEDKEQYYLRTGRERRQ